MRAGLADRTEERWEAWESSLAVACVEMVMSETILFDGGHTDFPDAGAEETGLDTRFQELRGPGRGMRWFASADVLIRELEGFCLNVRARTEVALEQLRNSVPGDWLEG